MDILKAVSQSPLHMMVEFSPHNTLVRYTQLLPQFTDRETEVQRGQVICLNSHSSWFKPGDECLDGLTPEPAILATPWHFQ